MKTSISIGVGLTAVLLSGCVTQQGPTQEDYGSFQNFGSVFERCTAAFPEIKRDEFNDYGSNIDKLSYRDRVSLEYCEDYSKGHIPKYELAGFCMPETITHPEIGTQLTNYYNAHNLKMQDDYLKEKLQSYKVIAELYPCSTSS